MQKLEVKKEFPYSKIGSYRNANPYVIAFVYPKIGNGFIVKGGVQDVRPYIQSLNIICIVHYTYFNKKETRNLVDVLGGKNVSIYISSPHYPRENNITYDESYNTVFHKNVRNIRRVTVTVNSHGKGSMEKTCLFKKTLRHAPRKWMKELDPFVA